MSNKIFSISYVIFKKLPMCIQMEAKIIKKKIKLIKMLTHKYQYLHFLIISNIVYQNNGK
jgi:hypothetical protein